MSKKLLSEKQIIKKMEKAGDFKILPFDELVTEYRYLSNFTVDRKDVKKIIEQYLETNNIDKH